MSLWVDDRLIGSKMVGGWLVSGGTFPLVVMVVSMVLRHDVYWLNCAYSCFEDVMASLLFTNDLAVDKQLDEIEVEGRDDEQIKRDEAGMLK